MALGHLLYRVAAAMAAVLYCLSASGAEFFEHEVEPRMAWFVLTERSMAIAVEHGHFDLSTNDEYLRFFIADRADYQFRRFDRDEFMVLLDYDHYIARFRTHDQSPYDAPWSIDSPFCVNERDPAEKSRDVFAIGQSTLEVLMDCKSDVSDIRVVDNELWIATFRYGEYRDGTAEGVLVASLLDGRILDRIDVGRSPARAIIQDPWSTDVWVVTDSRLSALSEDRTVRFWVEPAHGFDDLAQRPDVLLQDRSVRSDPLAIIAYALGKRHYGRFYDAVKDLSFVPPEGLLTYFYGASHFHQPRLPGELAPLLSDPDPTHSWRRFACMLDGEQAKVMCETPIDKWTTGTP